jgi:hypothetical protein
MPVTLTVTLHDNGQLQLSGPVENKVFCLGLLRIAEQAVIDHRPAEQPRVLTAAPMPVIPSRG